MSIEDTKVNLIELRPNKILIDKNFESYKLYFSNNNISFTNLSDEILTTKPHPLDISYMHYRLYNEQNNIFMDPFSNSIKIFTVLKDGSIYSFEYDNDTGKFINSTKVYEHFIKENNEGWEIVGEGNSDTMIYKDCDIDNRYPYTVNCLSKELVVAGNGMSKILLFDRSNIEWNVIHRLDVDFKFIISDVRIINDNVIYILTKSIIHKKDCPKKVDDCIQFLSKFTLFILKKDEISWNKESEDIFYALGNVELCTFDYDLENVIVQSISEPFVINKEKYPMYEDGSFVDKNYAIKQTDSHVSISFIFPYEIKNEDVSINISSNVLTVLVKGEEIFKECLKYRVKSSTITIKIFHSNLYLEVEKDDHKLWDEYIVTDNTKFLQPSQFLGKSEDECRNVPLFHEREECDDERLQTSFIYWLDISTLDIINQSSLITEMPLFSQKFSPNIPTSICIPEDVDGILWEFPSKCENRKILHKSTFNALSYIQASKGKRRYTISSPFSTYVAIVEDFKNIHIYWCSEKLSTEGLVNRKSGKSIGSIAKQNIISLTQNNSTEFDDKRVITTPIVGCICLEDCIIIGLKDNLVHIKL
uniref:NudC domain-containing protein 1 n=1 Tax=Parastrongyloides trichosuri TaxID=131310 RepID=A0A0N4ZTN8_PARTI